MGIEVKEVNGWKKVEGVYSASQGEDSIETALSELAKAFKETPLPPEDEAYIYTILSPIGSGNEGDADNCKFRVAAKIMWQDGIKVPPLKEGLLPGFWNSMFKEMVYGKQ